MRGMLPNNTTRTTLTILMWDIAGSCVLLRSLGLENFSQVVRAAQEDAAETIFSHGGFVARYMGDGLLAYFGFPEQGADDPERAVRAALSLPLAFVARGILVRARAALATGPVIVGAALGSGSARECPAFGEAPNLAARLLSVAPSPGVVMDEATAAAVGGHFACTELKNVSLKGFPHVRHAWQVVPPGHEAGRPSPARPALGGF